MCKHASLLFFYDTFNHPLAVVNLRESQNVVRKEDSSVDSRNLAFI